MVHICNLPYEDEKYIEHFQNFSFELSDFQKYAIESIVTGNHILITAHTGSGKTLPAEFAIEYFTKLNKKVIYTSPIKALSNQKYYEFSKQYPHLSIGILTGDVKFNPDAQVLIMTTEILQNNLYKRLQSNSITSNLHFNMDIDNELGCVVFDEIHYINDKDRGKVWEETILLLPKQIQMIMLSATIDKPENFANWCEKRYEDDDKKVYLASTNHRVVPLKHYIYLNTSELLYKKLKNEDLEKELKKDMKKLILLKEGNNIEESSILKMNKIIKLMEKNNVFSKPTFVLNSLIEHLKNNEMLPAICFVFSRRNVEKFASQITVNLFDYDDAHVPSIIKDECYNIIKKLPNHKEYLNLPEYLTMIGLLEKGVAVHHSGIMPILREMVELLFAKGYIKVLFATETFAVGINMPTKSVIFTSLTKYDNSGMRCLYSHEYTQMAGRAGRRGLDTIGHVIHCNNLFQNQPYLSEYKDILSGKPQTLISKFKISYSLLLNLIALNKLNMNDFINSSMIYESIQNGIKEYEVLVKNNIELIDKKKDQIQCLQVQLDKINQYIDLTKNFSYLNNKKKKQVQNDMDSIKSTYNKSFDRDIKLVKELIEIENEKKSNEDYVDNLKNYVASNVTIILTMLKNNKFIDNVEEKYNLTTKGVVASNVHECHCLVLSDLIYSGELDELSIIELISFLSCFTNISVTEDYRRNYIEKCDAIYMVKNTIHKYEEQLELYLDFEECNYLDTGSKRDVHYDLIFEIIEWCNASDEFQCKGILNKLEERGIFLGEFVKALLSINNIANECVFVCEYLKNIPLLEKLNSIPNYLLKYIVTNQSLYI